MRNFLLIVGLIIVMFALSACGTDDDGGADDTGSEDVSVDVNVAEALYKNSCASCHGNNLEGDLGPSLEKIGKDLSADDIKKQIKDGGKNMPPGLLDGGDAEQVAEWLATKK